MKKIIISVLSAALVFASCQKEAALVENGTKTVSFTATTPETRTSFAPKDGDSYPVLWSGDEKVSVSYNYAAGKNSAVTPSADGKTATFAVAISQSADATAHNFYAVSPASALISASSEYYSLSINVPSTQTPIDGSCDEAAQVIVAKHESDSFDENVNFAFKHVTAYGNLSITLPAGVSEISSITLTAEKGISGRIYYYPADATFDDTPASSSITLLTGKTSEVFFACLPADLSNTSLKVVISANGTTYTKNVTLSSNFKFAAGRVSKFSVDMSGVKADEKVVYNLVTDPTTLKVGDNVIIAATYKDVVYALGTTGTTYRNAVSVTVSGNSIVNPSDAVQILTLAKGSNDNTCAFKAGSNYLCASTEDKNNLETQGTLDAYGSFRVSYADGVTTIKSKGKSTRNIVKYNYNNGNPRFSCYTSGQVDVVIYSDGKGTGAQLFSTAVDETPTTPETPTFSSLAELVSKLEPTTAGTPVNVTLTNEKIVNIYTTGNYRNGIFLQVGDRQIEIYCKDVPVDWEVGGTVSGTLKECVWQDYKGTWELCPTGWSELTYTAPAGDTPATPTYASLADLVAAGEPTGGKVNVTLTNEEILSIYTTTNGYRNGIFLQVGDRQIEIYCKDVPDAWVEGGTVSGTLKECVWKNFNGTWELCPTNWSELTYTAPADGGDPEPPTGNSIKFSISDGDFTGGASGRGSEITSTSTPITITMDNGFADGTTAVRLYSGSLLTVSSNAGKISKIELTSTASGTSKYGPSSLELQDSNGSSSYSGKVTTWTGSSSSVTFKATAQYRFTNIVVYYE